MKKDKLEEMLDEEIKDEILGLQNLEPGSKEKSTAIDGLTKLYQLRIDETKLRESTFKVVSDELSKKAESKERVKDRFVKLGVDVAGIILPLAFYAFWMKSGFKFEETGTYTSTTFRGLFNRFKPTK